MKWVKTSWTYSIQYALLVYSFNPFGHGQFLDPYFKVLSEDVKLNFQMFFHRGICSKKFCKVKNFLSRYGLSNDILSKGQKDKGEGGDIKLFLCTF